VYFPVFRLVPELCGFHGRIFQLRTESRKQNVAAVGGRRPFFFAAFAIFCSNLFYFEHQDRKEREEQRLI
jgi:hypothetical protein